MGVIPGTWICRIEWSRPARLRGRRLEGGGVGEGVDTVYCVLNVGGYVGDDEGSRGLARLWVKYWLERISRREMRVKNEHTLSSIVSLFPRHGIWTKPSSLAIFALARTHSLRFIKLLLLSLDSSMRSLLCAFESSYLSLPARLKRS